MKCDHNIAIDLEWTSVFYANKPAGLHNEIIEIGAVKLGSNGDELDVFAEFVKPTYARSVTHRVRRITGIRDRDLAAARPFEDVLLSLANWIGNGRSRMITWGGVDRTQIFSECEAKGIKSGLPRRWLDLQKLYPRLMGTRRRQVSLGEAADWCGLEFDKRHRAMYDARATEQLFNMAATGSCTEQRRALSESIRCCVRERPLGASIADRCDASLAELLSSLASKDAITYA